MAPGLTGRAKDPLARKKLRKGRDRPYPGKTGIRFEWFPLKVLCIPESEGHSTFDMRGLNERDKKKKRNCPKAGNI